MFSVRSNTEHMTPQPVPTDSDIVQCGHCRQHFDAFFETITAKVDAADGRHPSDVALAYYRALHVKDRHDRP